ncbi:LXG domain of WXG superfamily protein [Gracilibacillus kekensis]|uniref:LXG domain of WXG superfamily protein n=1 Tax=Gracilibacillus kekensis TaxID=1027249 RepID=A0A1M7JZ62_9BACI|nr:polymorphic toxin type 15 domain-containing protein [Gracilibacillus kekensis]SHM57827.1 LXG domain of WXG superfamily protein [Gracilibacillus kekensis]
MVDVPFLERDLAQGVARAFDIVDHQREDLQSIFSRVNDLVSLKVFSIHDFEERMEDAENKRKKTRNRVKELDQLLLEHYQQSSIHEQVIVGLMQEMFRASSQGGEVSPVYFNEIIYQQSEIHEARNQAKEMTADYLNYQKELEEHRELQREIEEMENRPWYEKTWDTVCTFTGELTGDYDAKRASTGIDPVTGEKLTTAERITAGSLAAAGFIPVVGWAGRAIKGGKTIHTLSKGAKVTDHALDVYQNTKAFDILKQTEYGIYGLASYNGFSEYITGKDMFGNELSEEKRNQSLTQSLFMLGIGGASVTVDRMQANQNIRHIFPTENPPGTLPKLPKTWTINNAMTRMKNLIPEVRVVSEPITGINYPVFMKRSGGGTESLEGLGKGSKSTGNAKHLDDVPRIKKIEVNFKRNVKHDSEEFARQLKDQEKGMNELTVDEYLRNRERYIAEGRAIEGNAAQKMARQEALKDKITELRKQGFSRADATKQASNWMDTQAALHNPDQIAGGRASVIGGFGDKRVNSSLGSQWKYRIDIVDEQIRKMAENMSPEELKNTYLNVKLNQ